MAVTVYEPQKSQGTGKAFTPAEQEAYDTKWQLFVTKMKSRPVGGVRQFRGVITEITEPEEVANNYPGALKKTRVIRRILAEITEPGLEGLRFQTDSADNPRNDKTKLYALYVAVFKEQPPAPYTRWAFDFDTMLNVPIMLTIEKGGPRDDNKRGGIKAYLTGFDAVYEDEEDTRVTPPTTYVPPQPKTAVTSRPAPQPRVPVTDEDEPWA